MRCHQALPYLERLVDSELGPLRRFWVLRHLRGCPACAARRDELLELRARIRSEAPRYTAPAELRARVGPLLAQARPNSYPRWGWVGAGAVLGSALTILVWFAGTLFWEHRMDEDLAHAAVNAHVRATLDNAAIQVASSDQHTVKPWLSARLDYSPPVRDLAAGGFPLVGARIEKFDGLPVATLAYRYRQHTVDVFVRPDWFRSQSSASRSIRGFNVVQLKAHGMDWLIVSDTNLDALGALARQLAEDLPGPASSVDTESYTCAKLSASMSRNAPRNK